MKLPKPGNVKLPKPGNLSGKLPGGLKLPAFQMKNGFLKKNLLTLIAAAVLLVGTGTAYGTLSTREADRGYDPVEGVNQDRYQVLVSGEGYKLTKLQERNYKLQKKQNEVNAAQAAENAFNNPTSIRTSSGTRFYRSSNYRYRYRGNSSYRSTGTVFISTNIYTQKNSKANWKAGDTFSFMVTAYTYQNGKKKTLSKDKIKVTSSKGTLKYAGKKDDNQRYELKLGEGTNKITITAKNNKKTSKSTYTISAGKKTSAGSTKKKDTSNTGNTGNTKPKVTEATVDVGFGLTSNKMKIKSDTQAYDVLSNTPGITTSNREVIEVKGKFNDISITDLPGYKEDYRKDELMDKCREVDQEGIEEDKEKWRDEIYGKLQEELEADNPDLSPEEINGLIEDEFDSYYDSYYFEKYYNKWIKEVRLGDTITTGSDFYGVYRFKWDYDKVTGTDVLKKINLRLILEKI